MKVKVEDALCFSLYAASRTMTALYRPYLKEIGLTYPQFLVMVLLWEKDSQSLKSIGERLLLDSGTLTPLIKRLERMELISRQRSDRDERQLFVSLTQKGLELEKTCEHIPQSMYCQLELNDNEFVNLRNGVREWIDKVKGKVWK